MIDNPYALVEQEQLLDIARQALIAAANRDKMPQIQVNTLSPALQAERACFVTLTQDRLLRGCTGTLAARNPLAIETIVTTRQTALTDPRFPPVAPHEVSHIHIEISILTPMASLPYADSDDLLRQLRPGIDGLMLQWGRHRATFLPQVWERVPDPAIFLDMLCDKMNVPTDSWRHEKMEAYTYQSIIIAEPHDHIG